MLGSSACSSSISSLPRLRATMMVMPVSDASVEACGSRETKRSDGTSTCTAADASCVEIFRSLVGVVGGVAKVDNMPGRIERSRPPKSKSKSKSLSGGTNPIRPHLRSITCAT